MIFYDDRLRQNDHRCTFARWGMRVCTVPFTLCCSRFLGVVPWVGWPLDITHSGYVNNAAPRYIATDTDSTL